MWRTASGALCLALAFLLFAGVAEGQDDPSPTEPSEYVPAAGGDAPIRPGDQIRIEIWREPDFSGVFNVDEQGEITLPRLGRMRVTTGSANELQTHLREEFGAFLRNPSVDVVVLRRVGVHGEVRRPQLYMVDLTMTVRDVIALAGGVLETGNPNRVTIVRGGEEIRLERDEIASFATAELRSGDQIVVGRRSWFALNPIATITTAATVGPLLVGLVTRLFR